MPRKEIKRHRGTRPRQTYHALYTKGLSVKSSLRRQILNDLQQRDIWREKHNKRSTYRLEFRIAGWHRARARVEGHRTEEVICA